MDGVATWIPLLADEDHGWGHMFDWGGGWMWLWGFMMVTFWVVVIGSLVWWIARASGVQRTGPHDRAREILAERYARGELSTEEYRERLEALQ